MTQRRPYRNRRQTPTPDIVWMLQLGRAIRRGGLPLADPSMVAECDRALADYREHRGLFVEAMLTAELAKAKQNIAASLVAAVDDDPDTRARARELYTQGRLRAQGRISDD